MPEKEPIPKDKVNLRLLSANGNSHEVAFGVSASCKEVVERVFHNWPSGWNDNFIQKPANPDIIRLIYRGRFLHPSVTLSSISLPLGKTTVLHIVIREKLPVESSTERNGPQPKSPTRTASPSSSCCILL